MPDPARTESPSPVGERCARCHRYLVGATGVRRGLRGRWRHASCADAPAPTAAELAGLAEVLMTSRPWPRVVQLTDELTAVTDELDRTAAPAARVPAQAGPPLAERIDDHELRLRDRRDELHEALATERSWKARRLAVEWADGH